jgi:predicted ester cyclase
VSNPIVVNLGTVAGSRASVALMHDRDDGPEPFEDLATRLAARIMDLGNTEDADARALGIREVFAPDYVLHPSMGGAVIGIDAYIDRIAANLGGLPGMQFTMVDLVAQGDRFALRYRVTAPLGDREFRNEALEINRVANGQVVETWNYQNMLSVLVQLGVMDDPLATPT